MVCDVGVTREPVPIDSWTLNPFGSEGEPSNHWTQCHMSLNILCTHVPPDCWCMLYIFSKL